MGREERYRTVISGMEPRRICRGYATPALVTLDDETKYCIEHVLSIRQPLKKQGGGSICSSDGRDAREIPRPAGKNAGLRDNVFYFLA